MRKVIPWRPSAGVPLSNDTLELHSQSQHIDVPTYDRSALQRGIVHIGAGNFHRAHQAVYFDDLANSGVSNQWGVTGISLRSSDVKDVLSAQDGLYTVVERGHDGETARVVGSIGSVHYAPNDGAAVRAALADPHTRVVSLTITGNGYFLDPVTREFDASHPDVRADLTQSSGSYVTAWGYLADALDLRRRAGTPPFTVLCCDNIPDNTAAARTALVSFAGLKDPGLARWIDTYVAFPSTMVDRITPQTSESEVDFVRETFGIADKWPVLTEPHSQWVIEDSFCDGRPPLDEVGAQFVANVDDHKLVKTRLLNGTHIAMSCLATLAGYKPHRRSDGQRGHLRLCRAVDARRDPATAAGSTRDEHSPVPLVAAHAAEQPPDERPVDTIGTPGVGEDRIVPAAVAARGDRAGPSAHAADACPGRLDPVTCGAPTSRVARLRSTTRRKSC